MRRILLLVLCFLTLTNTALYELKRRKGFLDCWFVDVGQGDAVFITYRGIRVLIDGGGPSPGFRTSCPLLRFLAVKRVERIDLAILTHPHSDHLYGLVSVLEKMPVSAMILPPSRHQTRLDRKFRALLSERAVQTAVGTDGMTVQIGPELRFSVLHPSRNDGFTENALDNLSLVVKMEFQKSSVLFTGDIYREAENRLIRRHAKNLRSTVLKIPHHGSRKASSWTFLSRVRPEFSIISCGRNNVYGFPHADVLERLSRISPSIHRTDKQGTLRLRFHKGRMIPRM